MELHKLFNAGTSEGVKKAWETRKASGGSKEYANDWQGEDHVHANGKVRVLDEEGHKTYHVFDKHGVEHWQASVGAGAPQSLQDATLKAGKAHVEGLKGGVADDTKGYAAQQAKQAASAKQVAAFRKYAHDNDPENRK